MCMYVYVCIYGYVYMYIYIGICRRSSRMAMLRSPRSKTTNHKPCIIISSSPYVVYMGVFICIGVYVCVHVYICKIIVDPIWTVKVKSLKCHSLYMSVLTCLVRKQRMLVGRFFLPFISKWLGREMGFYVPLSPTWEPGSCVRLAPPSP